MVSASRRGPSNLPVTVISVPTLRPRIDECFDFTVTTVVLLVSTVYRFFFERMVTSFVATDTLLTVPLKLNAEDESAARWVGV